MRSRTFADRTPLRNRELADHRIPGAWVSSVAIAAGAMALGGCTDVIGADFDVHAACETCPVVLAEDLPHPKSVAVADGFVFWVESTEPGRVMKVPVGGGDPVVVAEGEHVPNQVAARGGYVYWTTTLADGAVRRAKTSGGAAEDFAPHQAYAIGLALDATTAYWTAQGSKSVRSLRLDASPSEGAALASDIGSPSLVAVDDTDVYFTQFGEGGGLWKVAISGGTATKLLEDTNANAIALLGDMACVTTFTGGTTEEIIDCVGKDGNGQMRAAKDRNQPTGMVADGERLFWGEVGLGAIVQGAPLGATKIVAEGQDSPNGLAIDGENLYWANFTDHGTIVKMKIP